MWKALKPFVLIFVLAASDGAAEPVSLACNFSNGWKWSVELNIEDRILKIGEKRTAEIVEISEQWILAQHAMIGKEVPFSSNWVIDRTSGKFWLSTFAKWCRDSEGNDCSFGTKSFSGVCAPKF